MYTEYITLLGNWASGMGHGAWAILDFRLISNFHSLGRKNSFATLLVAVRCALRTLQIELTTVNCQLSTVN